MKLNLFLLFTTFLLLNACQLDKKNAKMLEYIKIDPTKTKNLKRSELFSLNKIIHLETQPKSVIGDAFWADLVIYEDFIVVSSNTVSLYDKTGCFLYNIGKKGKGPGEYLSKSKILLCNNRFRMLDRTQQKFIDYNINGDFKEEHHFGMYGQSFICWNDFNIVYTGTEQNEHNKRLFFYNDKFELIDSYFSLKEKYHYMSAIDKTNFFIYQDSLRFLNAFDYQIYDVNIERNSFKIQPRYYLDFGRHEIPKSFFEQDFNDVREYVLALEQTNYAHRISGFIESSDNVLVGFKYKKSLYLAIYCKHSQKTVVVDQIYDDLIFYGLNFPSFSEFMSYYYFDNQVYFFIDSYRFLDNMKKMKEKMSNNEWKNYKANNPEIAKLYNKIDKNDNPIIFVFDLKPLKI